MEAGRAVQTMLRVQNTYDFNGFLFFFFIMQEYIVLYTLIFFLSTSLNAIIS